MPAQSDSVPLVNIYFMMCMAFSLSAMIWFSMINKLREMKVTSIKCRKITILYLSYIVCRKKERDLLIKSYFKFFMRPNNNSKLRSTKVELKISPMMSCFNKNDKNTELSCSLMHKDKSNKAVENIWVPLGDNQIFNMNRFEANNNYLKDIELTSAKSKLKKIKNTKLISNQRMEDEEQIKYLTKDQITCVVFDIINRSVFILFLFFILNLNFFVLFIFPYFLKPPPLIL